MSYTVAVERNIVASWGVLSHVPSIQGSLGDGMLDRTAPGRGPTEAKLKGCHFCKEAAQGLS